MTYVKLVTIPSGYIESAKMPSNLSSYTHYLLKYPVLPRLRHYVIRSPQ